jgi:nudix-type nucleoside diphosphatase (YffH/AdpP family)
LRHSPARGDVTILADHGLWGEFFKLRRVTVAHKRFDGASSGPLPREGFIGTDAALLLAYDPAHETVLMVEQFRVGLALRQDANPWSLEPVAGIVDGGETPEDAARREAAEEAGIEAGALVPMFDFYPSPGASTDHFYCFATVTDLGPPRSYFGGLDAEAEDLRLHIVPLARALDLIETGEITAGPLITMLYWLDRNRARLASSA